MVSEQAQVLVVLAGPLMVEDTTQIVDLSLKNRLPLMVNGSSAWVQSGALMSYTPPYSPQFRYTAQLIDKIKMAYILLTRLRRTSVLSDP
jgi:ABC-type uncharacterized transport system substrate-binding protein